MSRPSLLYVDDNEADRRLLETACREIGWDAEIVVCEDGAAAERALSERAARGEPPPTLVLDLKMPGVDGWDVLSWLATRRELARDVVVLTSSRQIDDLRRAEHLGAARYLIKPMEYEGWLALAATLRQHVGEAAPSG